jgi:hypothetical protein
MYAKSITIPGAVAVVLAAAFLQQFAVEAAPPRNPDPRRAYYVTRTTHTGSQALTACAAGYHMASVFEIFVPAVLRYETALGAASFDSGFGPPSGEAGVGWVRTGDPLGPHCDAWTIDEGPGSAAALNPSGDPVSPHLQLGTRDCASPASVWCIQD